MTLLVSFSIAFGRRLFLMTQLVIRQPVDKQAQAQFCLEWAKFILTALGIAGFNYFIHDFPLVSGTKIAVGCVGLGFFTAVDLALERERLVSQESDSQALNNCKPENLFPLTFKFALVASGTIALATFIPFLVFSLDMGE